MVRLLTQQCVYFAVENENIAKRFGTEVTDSAKDRFCYGDKDDVNKVPKYFPIIPDVRVLRAIDREYDTETHGVDAELPYPSFPKFNMEAFDKTYKKPIKKRIRKIVHSFTKNRLYTFGFRLFLQRKAYKIVKNSIEKSLKESELL